MNRWKASGLHLLLSVLLIGGVTLGALLLWYPYGLYRVTGQGQLLKMMLAVDLMVGPLLTLLVYKHGKPSLRFDLSVIALAQLAFLSVGMHTLWVSRPVFLVASDVRFNLVFANEIEPEDLAKAPRPEWRQLSNTGPVLVGVKPPTDKKEREDLMFRFVSTGVDIDKQPRYYVEFSRVEEALRRSAGRVPSKHSTENEIPLLLVPVLSRYGSANIEIDADSGKPLKVSLMDEQPN